MIVSVRVPAGRDAEPALAYLEEALEPPDLEEALANQYHELEDAPPLDARVGAFGSIPVYSFADNDVALLVLDLCDEFRHLADCNVISISLRYYRKVWPYPPSPTDLVVLHAQERRQCRAR
jgi:hypothetical protein